MDIVACHFPCAVVLLLAFVDSGKSTLRFIGHHLRPNLTANEQRITHGCHACALQPPDKLEVFHTYSISDCGQLLLTDSSIEAREREFIHIALLGFSTIQYLSFLLIIYPPESRHPCERSCWFNIIKSYKVYKVYKALLAC